MEELVASLAEKTIVGAAFIYLLYWFVSRFNVTLLSIADRMNDIGRTLTNISHTLSTMDKRMEVLEKRVDGLEVKKDV